MDTTMGMRDERRLDERFGEMVFDEVTMRERLSKRTFEAWKRCVAEGIALDAGTADEIAEAMKQWAVERGATHFTHWFQPMTGATAEKHDSFITPTGDGRALLRFSGKELIKGEPDASSFPSGGLRSTFEARGYTAWDPSSFAFVKEDSLYIPTAFCAYSGQALDKKMPLLRSMDAVSKEALRILRLFGDTESKRVVAQVGAEQEYFLLDKKMYARREDLRLCGRTLFGAQPPRGQELEDHYFGMIKPRVAAFMKDFDEELWKLGVPSSTKHNEVAPSQHEMATVYSDANKASDHNQLAMEMLKKVADRHDFVCLIHEKPYEGVNGSGKHDNWSLATDTGRNLFKPGSTPSQNMQFLIFLAAFVAGVDEYQGLLRCSISSAANDHRLGGNEAPPAIMSIFLGSELSDVVDSIVNDTSYTDMGKHMLEIGVGSLPEIRQDNTDRNRTSPMAFTGNKFEFRMLGSSDSVSGPNIILNTMMAEELSRFAEELEEAAYEWAHGAVESGMDLTEFMGEAVHTLLQRTFREHGRILFDGNGYRDEWVDEAERRGLKNLRTTADSLAEFISPESIELLTKHGIYQEEEIHARHAVYRDKYVQEIVIEARTMIDMIHKDIMPAVSTYSGTLCERALVLKAADVPADCELGHAKMLGALMSDLASAVARLEDDLVSMPDRETDDAMFWCRDKVLPDMADAREAADQMELLVDRKAWPFPTYQELMFSER